MRKPKLACLAMLAIAATTSAPARASVLAPYPAVEVLDAVKAACSRLEKREETVVDLATNGWVPVTLPAESPLGQLLAMGKAAGEAMMKAGNGSVVEPGVYAKTVAGEELKIILSGVSMAKSVVNGCRAYDVGETRPIPVDVAETWFGKPADRSDQNETLSIASWSIGPEDDGATFDIYFVPANSPLVAAMKVSGVAIRMDYVGAPK